MQFKKNSIIRTNQYPHTKAVWRVLGFQTAMSRDGRYQILYCEQFGHTANKKIRVNLMSFVCRFYNKQKEEEDEKNRTLVKNLLKKGNIEMARKILTKLKSNE